MKTLKIMSIVGLVMSGLSWIFIATFSDNDTSAAIGWGAIAMFYLIAFSIVVLVKSLKELKRNDNN